MTTIPRQTQASVVSDMTERGSQNGRSFGRGAYNNKLPESASGARRTVQAMISSARRTDNKRPEIPQSVPEHIGMNEIGNNHADTICAAPPLEAS